MRVFIADRWTVLFGVDVLVLLEIKVLAARLRGVLGSALHFRGEVIILCMPRRGREQRGVIALRSIPF